MRVHIGTSGYNYKHWSKGVFYPDGLPQSRWLDYYVKHFDTVELNVTFYRLPKESAFKSWDKRSPEGFVFAVKGSRYMTHLKRLKDSEDSLKKLAGQVAPLRSKIGCYLWQMPPNFKRNDDRLRDFCRNIKKNHHFRLYKQVFEFRHDSWFAGEVYDILRENGFCLCWFDSTEIEGKTELTSDYLYLRFHGSRSRYSSDYTDKELKAWARKIKKHKKDIKDVYVYFNNDAQGYAVKNARTFRGFLE
ncbi:MAG: DUF72 domain-containing protein [Candidatus Omnitrophota bacterium]